MEDEKEYMEFEEKVALSKIIEKLPVNEQPYIYRIVKAKDPASLVDCEDDPDWTYIYFHTLKPSALRELEGYLESRNVNTREEIQENNPAEENEENNVKSLSYTEKLRSNKGTKAPSKETTHLSIKTRLRRSSTKPEIAGRQ